MPAISTDFQGHCHDTEGQVVDKTIDYLVLCDFLR